MELVLAYKPSILVLGFTGFTFFIQLLIADIVSIRQGHTPGTIVEQSHDNFLFRASRVFANSNETLGILVLFMSFAILSSANPFWINSFAVVYLIGRWGHMICYYANLKLLRSISFVISAIGLLGIFIVGTLAWF